MEIMGPLQIRVMHKIWRNGSSTVHEVHDELNSEENSPKLAYTTILTVMRNLVKREILEQKKEGRSHTFLPNVTEYEYKKSMLSQICSEFFDNDKDKLINMIS